MAATAPTRLGLSRSPFRTTMSPGEMSAPRRAVFWVGLTGASTATCVSSIGAGGMGQGDALGPGTRPDAGGQPRTCLSERDRGCKRSHGSLEGLLDEVPELGKE